MLLPILIHWHKKKKTIIHFNFNFTLDTNTKEITIPAVKRKLLFTVNKTNLNPVQQHVPTGK